MFQFRTLEYYLHYFFCLLLLQQNSFDYKSKVLMDPGTGAKGKELSWGFGLRHWTRQKGDEQCNT